MTGFKYEDLTEEEKDEIHLDEEIERIAYYAVTLFNDIRTRQDKTTCLDLNRLIDELTYIRMKEL